VIIRFLIDAQLPPGLVRRLATRGFIAEHVNRIGLGVASDSAIWRYAARTDATLVTKDEDFVALARREPAGPRVLWIRVGNISNDGLWRVLDPLLDQIIQALNAGERIVEVF
jgi:predicted nuclease of predicted toxin-antitoxin system